MGVWVDSLGGVLRDAGLASAGLFSVVLLAMLGCRQPVRRICLARCAIVGSLALILMVGLSPLPRVELVGILRDPKVRTHPYFDDQGAPWPGGVSAAGGMGRTTASSRPAHRFLEMMGRPPRALVVVYLACAGCGLAWLLLGHAGLEWVTRRSSRPSAHLEEIYQSLPFSPRRTRPRLRVSNRVHHPVLVGLIRQTILIPAALDRSEAADQLRLSLLHELAHAERLDSWFGLASSLSQITWFFMPPLWWIRAQMRLDQEFMADRIAASRFGPLQAYASSLVGIASPSRPVGTSMASADASRRAGGSALFLRVLMLVRCPFTVESNPPRWWGWSLPSLVLLGTLGASCLTARIPAESAPTPWLAASKLKSRSFRMSRLVVQPMAPTARQPSPLFELPIPLPQNFDLSVDVWGDPASLAATRIVGRSLQHPDAIAVSPSDQQWHCVRIRRDQYGLTVWIDQHRLPRSRNTQTTSWLSVEPPIGRPGHFRNLHIVW